MKKHYILILSLFLMFSLSSYVLGKDDKNPLEYGNRYFKEADYDKAIEEYLEAVKDNVELGYDCYYKIGLCYQLKKDYENSIKYFKEALKYTEIERKLASIYFSIGICYNNLNQTDMAIESYIKSYENYPHADTYWNISILYEKLGKNDLAVRFYKEFIKYSDNEDDCKIAKVKIEELQNKIAGNTNDNITTGSSVQVNTQELNAQVNEGWEFYNNAAYDDAILSFNKVLLKDKDNTDAHLGLACSYHDQGLFDNALDEYKEVLRLNPDCFYPNFYSGIIYMNYYTDDKKALACFSHAVKFAANDKEKGTCYNYIGICHYNLSDYKNAVKNYESALKYNPSEPVYYYNIGLACYDGNDKKKAEEAFKKCKELDKAGDYTSAINECIGDVDGTNTTTSSAITAEEHYRLGWKYYDKQKYDRAKAEFLKAIELKPDYIDAYNDLGILYLRVDKDYEKSLGYFKKTVKLNQKYALGYYNIGYIYYLQEKYKDAKENFKKYLEIEPDGNYSKQAKKNINVCENFIKK